MPVTKERLVTPQRAALAGMVGPALFGGGLVTLTALQYDFLLGIGWEPLKDPSGVWPSGLSLGPYGWAQDLDFALSGSLLAVFAVGLHRGITGGSRSGPALLFVAGVAMALLAFETDPMDRAGPRTLHGSVHDAAFVLFVLALVPALFLLWRRMREDTRWRGHARYTLATALIASACLVLPGAAYYLFLAAVLAWFEVTAVKLWRTEALSTRVRA
jgi:uncharacterized membrane protein YidH (DUF202 family)